MSTPAGWYPDPAGSPQQRWWDGVQWTDQLAGGAPIAPVSPQQPAYGAAPLKAPEGTNSGTLWAWLIIVAYVAQALLTIPLLVNYGQVMPHLMAVAAEAGSSSNSSAYFRELMQVYIQLFSGSLGYLGLAWLFTAASILFAGLDWRELSRRGVPRPFHWAYAFFALTGAGMLVYMIGRTVVLRRCTGGGGAPMWVLIAITAAVFIGSIVWVGFLVGDMTAQLVPMVSDR